MPSLSAQCPGNSSPLVNTFTNNWNVKGDAPKNFSAVSKLTTYLPGFQGWPHRAAP
ncbi:hypothetical protein GA0074694_0266 [Micromonospora inyonensis]|uniref:Uncharacterized protein n=1 Tax=Micromonospora inyonensis TaxID=47866 RepID=A0A1C6R8C0_9ACTN|nr:hypothetical protein GA0074694_0266 [Micromonospora inyonensis]